MKNAVRYLCAFVLALGLLFAGSALAALPSGNTSCTWYWSCEGANRMIVTIADNSALYSSDKAYFKDSAGTTVCPAADSPWQARLARSRATP